MSINLQYNDVVSALNLCGMHTIKPGLERMQIACERLGHPERARPCVHVAGTNGKGSTIAFLESLLRANGYAVGRYTSPHLHDVRERITKNGCLISEADIVSAYEEVYRHCADLDLSYFEWLTLVAFTHFRAHPVDVLLLETGMGGRWDATNVATPVVSIITTIDYDHQAYLGNTLAQIAKEKCGILKQGVPAVIAQLVPEAMDVVQGTVAALGIRAQLVSQLSHDVPLGLPGDHQRQNAALAVTAARIVKESVTPAVGSQLLAGAHEFNALAATRWPGRLEWISKDPPILCDVAHNAGGMRTVVEYVNDIRRKKDEGRGANFGVLHFSSFIPRPSILLGVMSDKDAAGMVRVLTEISGTFYCVTPATDRALPAEELAIIVRDAGKAAVVTTIADMKRSWNGSETLIVTGSFHTVGEFGGW